MPLALRSQTDERWLRLAGHSDSSSCLPPGRLFRLVVKDRQRYSDLQKVPVMVLKRTVGAYRCDGEKRLNQPLEVVLKWMQPR